MNHLLLCLGSCWLLCSCTQVLEQQNVPLLGGIQFSSDCQLAEIEHDLELGTQFGIEEWMFEIGFVMDLNNPIRNPNPLELSRIDSLVQILKERSTHYSIAFNLENPREHPKEQVNIDDYLEQTSCFLAHMKNFPPRRMVFMGELINRQWIGTRLKKLVEIHKKEPSFANTEVVYAIFPYQFDQMIEPDEADLIGIRFHEPPDENIRAFFLKTNRALSRWLLEHQKGVMIVQANLLGENKQELFMNQLRFWDDEIQLQGVVLNSLYCTFSIRDTTSYFALGKDSSLIQYLKLYGN